MESIRTKCSAEKRRARVSRLGPGERRLFVGCETGDARTAGGEGLGGVG